MVHLQGIPPLPSLPISTDDIRSTHSFSSTAHWVIPNVLIQGARPGFGMDASDTAQLINQVRQIVNDGECCTFLCAQAECTPEEGSILLDNGNGGDRKSKPKDVLQYANHVKSVVEETDEVGGQPQFLYYGIIGMQTAQSAASLSNAVHDIAKRIQSGEIMYIHCGGGVGRAGLLTACVLGVLYEHLDAEAVLAYTNAFCQVRNMEGEEERHYSSPETDGQKDQVREFFTKIRG